VLPRLADNLRATFVPRDPRLLAAASEPPGPEGSWPDLDYLRVRAAGSSAFAPYPHLERALALAVAGREPEALEALRFWLRLDPHTDHGWFENLGVPLLVGQIAALLAARLSPAELEACAAILARGWEDRADPPLPLFGGLPATGQNLLWMAGNRAIGALLLGDEPLLRHTLGLIARELRPTLGEGVQPDWSFHQHGPLLYSGGYGAAFTRDALRWLDVLHGTPHAFPPGIAEAVVRHLLDGQQWMLRGDSWHFPVVGRELARPGHDTRSLAPHVARLAALGGPRAPEAAALARRLLGIDPPDTAPAGVRLFWRSDALACSRPAFSALVRLSSTRVRGHESGNGEAESAALLGDGACSLLVTGREHRDIYPLWDWRHIPGVTARHPAAPEPLPLHPWGLGAEGGSAFAGGVADGRHGAAAMRLCAHGVEARRSWFCLDDCVLALGSGLRGADAAPLRTTLDQRHAEGPATPLPSGGLHHGGVAWLPLAGPAVSHTMEERSGDWGSVNRALAGLPASARVFTAWLEHGPEPLPFAVAAVPGLAPAAAPGWLARSAPRILARHDGLHHVEDAAGTLAWLVFWEPGGAVLPDGGSLAVDAPCLVQWRAGPGGEPPSLHVGNPLGAARRVGLRWAGETHELSFPAGAEAGRPLRLSPVPLATAG
jgi:chondroitin AC lyase